MADLAKTFTHNGRAWAIDTGGELLRQNPRGEYVPANGTTRSAREAWEHAVAKWPEYTEAKRHG